MNIQAPRKPSFNERDVNDKPLFIRLLEPLTSNQIEKIDILYRQRLRTLLAVDDLVKSLVITLAETGQLNNTYIFFTSDNGFHLGEHRLQQGKLTAYTEDIRVSLLVRGPGVPVGESCSSLVLNNDLAPTFANLAGVIAPDFVDGRSLKPLLTSDLTQPQNWRSQFLIQHKYVPSEEESEIPIPSYRALRSNEYLYVEYESTERELYNLPSDLYQLKNIATEVDQGLVESLAAQLTELSTCKGISCQVIEDRPSVTLKSPAVK